MSDTVPVSVVRKNSKEEIRFLLDTYKGRRIVNIRVFYEGRDGVMLPGKGLAFAAERLPDFAKGVNDLLCATSGTEARRG